jgi:hypothetical protein
VAHVDGEVMANRPGIVIKNKQGETYMLVDMADPADRNVTQKETEM